MNPRTFAHSRYAVGAILVAAGMCVCATVDAQPMQPSTTHKLDPWENWNRKVFAFNEGLDDHVLKPVATAYQQVVPSFARNAVHNFFCNAEDAWSTVNHLLQGKIQSGFEMMVRFNTNTVFGFGGLLDIASEAGLERQSEDFGQTLGRWGFGAGSYVVWPVLGPSSVRDSLALPLDRSASPATVLPEYVDKLGLLSVQLIDTRANLLSASRVIDDIALDKYTFVRDGYMTRRHNLIYDGNPPEAISNIEKNWPTNTETETVIASGSKK